MSVTDSNDGEIRDVNRMVGVAHHVAKDLKELHGIKSVTQSKDDYCLVVMAHDDYALLSNIQTVCAWNQATFDTDSAGRVDGDIVARISVHD